ncbi:hypothetical protein [Mariprofundus ferrooxydans]|nr:hypothetical protein [Mariprofundus ferrooxydans]
MYAVTRTLKQSATVLTAAMLFSGIAGADERRSFHVQARANF